jgi:hypothetical protein
VPQKPLTIIKDEGKLVHYSFASKKMDHQVSCRWRLASIVVWADDTTARLVLRHVWDHRYWHQ